MLDELAHPAAVAGAGSRGQCLALKPAVVVGENLVGGHARILSEPPDGRLALVAGALCAAQGAWGSEKAACRHHPRALPLSSRAATSQRVRTASAARPIRLS